MPKTVPERPKYQQVADAIEAVIRTGKWDGGKMPSVRGIAHEYNVSIVTASRALQVLRDKGLIQSVERSGTFCLPAPTADRWAVVLRLTPGPLAWAVDAMTRGGLEALARREPMHLHFDAFNLNSRLTAEDAQRAAKTAMQEGIHGLIFLPSRASDADAAIDRVFLQGCRNAGLPVVLLERNLRRQEDEQFDLVGLDDLHGAMASTRHMMELGRRRIALVVASPTSSHNDRVAGYLFALHAARQALTGRKAEAFPETVIWLPDELPGEGVARHIADRVERDKLDAVICYHDYIAIGLVMELLRRGKRVPQDVAVSGFDNIDAGALGVRLTTVENPVETMAEQAVWLLRLRRREPQRMPVRIVVPSRLLIRNSTDPQAAAE